VLAVSFTFPATKLAMRDVSPWFVAFGRAAVAAIPAAVFLRVGRARRPTRSEVRQLALVAGGVVIGFPLLSTLALQSSSAAHGAVVVAVLPAVTAMIGTLRSRERPSGRFWLAAATGTATVTGYTVSRSHGGLGAADAELLLAVLACGVGYAEGGLLARGLGGPRTICWALVLSLPLTVPIALLTMPGQLPRASAAAGFLYTAFGAALLGFFAWYAGLARGGVARVSQIQLAQAPMTLLWSALVLGEGVGWSTVGVALAVLACVAATQRARVAGHGDRISAPSSALLLAGVGQARDLLAEDPAAFEEPAAGGGREPLERAAEWRQASV
jgi:drug/metabolite transporter (DMT)-like permease